MNDSIASAGVTDMNTDFSTISNLDFNKVWARDNYVNCNKTGNEKSASKPYPILNEKFKVSPETFAAGFNQKIPEAIPVEFDNSDVDLFFNFVPFQFLRDILIQK